MEEQKETKTQKHEFKAILRLADKEVKGEMPIYLGISKASGAGFMFAHAVCYTLKLDRKKPSGSFKTEEIDKIEDVMKNPAKYNIPKWLFNRRKDLDTGEDKHVVSSDLDLVKKFDIRRLKRIKSYVGMRHSRGDKKLKVRVRGQRTRSTGRTGKTVGVVRKKR
jgi:small subunit ribosomal protein S13